MATEGLSDEEDDVLSHLRGVLTTGRTDLLRLNDYYEGTQILEVLGMAVPPDLARFVTFVNWPRITVDAVEERLDVEGFRLPDNDQADQDLWRIWQSNDLDEESQLAHVDALVFGKAFASVGTNEEDSKTPLITIESPLELVVDCDPRTRKTLSALRLYKKTNDLTGGNDAQVEYATIYMPDSTVWLQGRSGTGSSFEVVDRDDHNLGVVPVVQLTNRSRTAMRYGVSEICDVITLTDAVARALTNAQVATEVAAIPQRWAAGMSKGDFVDSNGNTLPVWKAYFGSVWSTNNPDAKFGQFSAAELSNFVGIVDMYAHLVAGITGIPVRYFGQNTANPPSAEGIRADEARLVKSAERKQRAFGGSWEEVMRIVRRFTDGMADTDLDQLETIWRDPATPTLAQQADATMKLVQAGILPIEAAWEDLGYSQTRIARLREIRESEQADPTLERVARDLASMGSPQPVPNGVPPGGQPANPPVTQQTRGIPAAIGR